MKRRALLFGSLLVATPNAVDAQQASRRRIGFLYPQSDLGVRHPVEGELAKLGYVDGQTADFVKRFAEGKFSRFSALAAELLRADVEIIVASTTSAAVAAKKVTSTVPIVVLSSGDAVGTGLAQSLARPGGNVTGNSFLGTEFAAKQVQLVTELAPKARRIGFMANSRQPPEPIFFGQMQVAAKSLEVEILFIDTHSPGDFDNSLAEAIARKIDALICAPGGYSDWRGDRAALLAALERRPFLALHFRREFPEEGGLISHGPSWAAMNRQAAAYVDRILKGARAGDLPIVQPTHFELVVNMKTARRRGIAIPSLILARADTVID
ncbi:MAG: ABC transporter substrate-binding protein [Alphaproteobacteria bacterium]|nr:ABC transporter substrate-binding protein [Alphaproteobacteria bacterium]MCW5738932.1 ABC transporter substrate-binding protein [Alphaproteobacteria bacterium]